MSELVIVLVLAVISAVLAGIELARTKGQSLTCWGLLALALAVIIEKT